MGTTWHQFEDIRLKTLAMANEFSLPILMYHGAADKIVPSNGSEEFYNSLTIEDKEFHLLKNVYHEPHNDFDKEKVFSIINNWITKHI